MNWAWASSLDQLWRSPALPMWVTLAAGVFFALILLVTLFRAERSVANGALTVITLLAIGIAVAATVRSSDGAGSGSGDARASLAAPAASLPALSCLDGLAGDAVEGACEKALFASAESAAAAVSYTAGQITRLAGFGDEASANRVMTPELSALRRTVERDRYGLVAHVLSVRDGCTPADCAFFKSLSDHNQIAGNMTDRTYEGLIGRYALNWGNTSTAANLASAPGAPAPPSTPTGKPLSGDFPSSASIPPVSIMTPETGPPAGATSTPPKGAAFPTPTGAPRTAAAAPPPAAPPAAKKPSTPKRAAAPSAPVPLAPAAPAPTAAQSDDN